MRGLKRYELVANVSLKPWLATKLKTATACCCQCLGTVEPVFGNIRHNKRLTRLNHTGPAKVNTQWNLYCMVRNIEKLSKTTLGQHSVQ